MRIALISDLHGNLLALEAVLEDIARTGADRIVCLGDAATLGPSPHEVLARLREIGCACVLGNHDAFMLDPGLIRTYTEAPIIVASVDWCRAQLRPDEFAFIRTFQPTIDVPLDGGASLLLYHGTPRSHMEDLVATTPPERVDEMLAGRRATVLAGGHTHVQMLRQHRGLLLVNPGSVGQPFEEYAAGGPPKVMAHAEYATVEARHGGVDVRLRRVALDRRALRDAAAGSDCPLGPALAAQYAT